MIDDPSKLPQGIKNNNPGNLKERMGDRGVIEVRRDFAVYRTMLDGVIALSEVVHVFYVQHHLVTVRDFLGRYAPAMENDLLAYETQACKYLRIDIKEATTKDLRLDIAWRAIDLMRCIVHQENGLPPPQMSVGGEWFGPEMYANALRFVGNWGKL